MIPNLFDASDFMPHGMCYAYRPDILLINVIGDALIAVSYLSIPVAIVYFMHRRRDLLHAPTGNLFSAFIVMCGITHLVAIWIVWNPDYGVQGIFKMATAIVSAATAILIWRWLPEFLMIPSHAQMNAANQELAENKAFTDAVVDNIKDGIVACNAEGRLAFFNEAARQMHGIEARDLPPDQWTDKYDLYAGDGITRLRYESIPLYRALNGEIVEDQEIVIAPADGDPRHLLASGQAMFDAAGNKIGAVVSMHDVTAQKSVEAKLAQSQRLEAVGQLTGGVAHDFNNLLGVIVGNLDLLQDRVADDEAAAALVNGAIGAALRGGDLNQRLLVFARKQALRPQLIKIDEAIEDMVRLMERTLGERVTVEHRLAQEVWPVLADPAQVEAAILNLGVNARDAMPGGGRLVLEANNVHLDASYTARHPDISPGDCVVLSVTDTGIGMTPEAASRAFEPFFTTKETGAGSGLGLSMVHGFMQQSGGHVTIDSVPGVETTLKLYFPRATGSVARSGGEQGKAEMPRGNGERVLVVEDNVDMRATVVRQLRMLGYETIGVESGQDALDLLETGAEVGLVFSDVVMPGGVSGIELARAVRARHPGLPVLLTSGFAGAVTAADQTAISGIELLAKPYRTAELAVAIKECLGAAAPAGN